MPIGNPASKIPRVKFDTAGIPDLSEENVAARNIFKRLEESGQDFTELTADEASLFGFDFGTGWKYKAYFNEDKSGITFRFITPENWEIAGPDQFISPEGQTFSKQAYEKYWTDQQAAKGDEMLEGWRQELLTQLPANLQQEWADLSYQDLLVSAQGYYSEDLFQQLIEENPEYAEEYNVLMGNYPPNVLDDIKNTFNWWDVDPKYILQSFLNNPEDMFEALINTGGGKLTPEKANILKYFFPDMTDEEINSIFSKKPEAVITKEQQMKKEQIIANLEDFTNQILLRLEILPENIVPELKGISNFSQEAINEFINIEATPDAVIEWFEKYQGINLGSSIKQLLQEIRTGLPPGFGDLEYPQLLKQKNDILNQLMRWKTGDQYWGEDMVTTFKRMWNAGWGDVAASIAGAADWISESTGIDISYQIGSENLKAYARIQQMGVPTNLNWGWQMVRSLPFALTLIPTSIGGAIGGAAAASVLNFGKVGQWIFSSIGAVAFSRPLESLMEVGSSWEDLVQQYGESGAREKAMDIFKSNLVLSGWDLGQMLVALAPLPKGLDKIARASKLFQTAKIGGKVVVVGLTEGGEEVYQELIQRTARGEAFEWDDEMKAVFAVGGLMGAILGFSGDVIQSIYNKTNSLLTPETQKQLEDLFQEAKKLGAKDALAQLQALEQLSAISSTNSDIVQEGINQVKEELASRQAVTDEQMKQQLEKVEAILSNEDMRIVKSLVDITNWNPMSYGDVEVAVYRDIMEESPKPYMLTDDMTHVKGSEAVEAFAKKLGFESGNQLRMAINTYYSAQMQQEAISGRLGGEEEGKEKEPPKKERRKTQPPPESETKETGVKEITGYPQEIKQAFDDVNSGRVYIDKDGNYRIREEGELTGEIASWNEIAKREFKNYSELENSAKLAESSKTLGEVELTPAQIEKVLEFFGAYIESPTTENAWNLVQELRKETRAQRAEAMKARAQQLIAQGKTTEEAVAQAKKETMAGELPSLRSDYVEELTDRMRASLFDKVYQTLKDEPYEMMSTIEALTNALQGKPIPRKLGAGTDAFPKGGSAWLRLKRVFGSQQKLLEGIDESAKAGKPLEDIVEGIFHEYGRMPIPIDEKTAEYLRGLSDKGVEQTTLENLPESDFPKRAENSIIKVLKEIGMTIVDIGGFVRAMKSSVDMSYWRQAMPLIPNHKTRFALSNVDAWKALFSQKSAEAAWQRIIKDPEMQQLYAIYDELQKKKGRDFLRPLTMPRGTKRWQGTEEFGYLTEERAIPRFTGKIPWIKWSNRAFVTGVNSMTWGCFKDFVKAQMRLSELYAEGKLKLKKGETFNMMENIGTYAEMLAAWSGRASLGKLAPAAPILGNLLYAVRYGLGRAISPKFLFSSNKYVRKEAWKDAIMFIGVIAGVLFAGERLGFWEVEKDPRSADFMKIRIGNVHIDPWGGAQQFVVFIARVTGLMLSPITGEPAMIKSTTTGKMIPADIYSLSQNFYKSKQSPLIGLFLEYVTGKTFSGEKAEVGNWQQWVERIAPMSIQDIIEAMQDPDANVPASSILSFFGFGVQDYVGDWKKGFNKLGILKYEENLEYGLNEPVYNTGDYWADYASDFKGVDPENFTKQKGYEDYIKAIAVCWQIKEILDLLPNQSLVSLNTDSERGPTFNQLYQMWQDRLKLVASGDEDALKAFDSDERTSKAYLGNMTQSQYALLVKYYSILGEAERKAFLEEHPELKTNPRKEWLKVHPSENAELALWGQADIYTQAAYDTVVDLIKQYDIPQAAVEFNLPPEESVKSHFDYLAAVDSYGAQSAEAQFVLARDEDYTIWRSLQMPDFPTLYYELKAKNRAVKEFWDDLGDKGSPNYIADYNERKARLLEQFPDTTYFDDDRRCDALAHNFNEEQADAWAERGRLVDEFGANSAQVKLWSIQNQEVYQMALDNEMLTDEGGLPGGAWNEEALRIKVQYAADYDWYNEGIPEKYNNINYPNEEARAAAIADERKAYLQSNPDFRIARLREEALNLYNPTTFEKFPEQQVDNYVEYYELPIKGSRRERFLIDNPDFANAMNKIKGTKIPDPSKVPNVRYDDIYDQWKSKFDYVDDISNFGSPNYIADEVERKRVRDAMFVQNGKITEFGKAYIEREAWGKLIPDVYIKNYVEYYSKLKLGKPATWYTDYEGDSLQWYEDDWYLIEHPDFYNDVYLNPDYFDPPHKPRDFSKVPSRNVFMLYTRYCLLPPRSKSRKKFREEHPDLDAWLDIYYS